MQENASPFPQENQLHHAETGLKMVYLIGPDRLVNRRFANFHKMVWMTTVHIIHIHAVIWKFAYPQFTGYAEYIRFCHKEHLKHKGVILHH